MDIENQSSLNNPLDLKSPIFKPRPGWGGKFNNWFKSNFESKLLPILSIVVIIIGAYLYLVKNNVAEAPIKEIVEITTIEKVVQPHQGLTHVVRSVISEYLNKGDLDLSAEQKIFLETYLVNQLKGEQVKIGEIISFSKSDLNQAIEKARSLTPNQIKTWSRYIK